MAKQTINIGTRANDASGDTIRDAFDKVNDNFNEIYTEIGNPTSDLKFTGATISTDQTNQDLTLDPNGTGSVVVTGDLSVSGTITGNIQITNALTVVGDDSTGTTVSTGETFKIAGTQNVTTAVSGDTLTITGPNLSSYATTSYVDSQIGATNTLTIADDSSTTSAINLDNTLQVVGATGISTAVSGSTLTITGTAQDFAFSSLTSKPTTLSGYGITDAVASGSTAVTVVGDDSTGTNVNIGETFKIAGTQNVTTAVSGDTLTITGPDLSSYATQAYVTSQLSSSDHNITFVGDDSTGTAVTQGETFKIAGTQNVSTAVSGDTLTITGPDLSSYLTSETSHADVLVDGDFGSAGIMATNGSGTYSIVTDNSTNWNTAFGWGDHSSAGYATATSSTAFSNKTGNISQWTNDSGYLTSETSHADVLVDGDFGSQGIMLRGASAGTYSILTDNSSNWNTAYGWGDHASAGYLTSTGTQNIDNLSFNDNIISTSSNADLNLDPGGTGSVVIGAPLYIQKGYVESINTLTSSSTISVDCSLASVHKVTLAENTGFVINNLPTGGTVTLIITQDGGGSNTATFGTDGSTAVKFAGSTPTLSTAGGAIDVVTIFNDGTNYLGNIAKAYA